MSESILGIVAGAVGAWAAFAAVHSFTASDGCGEWFRRRIGDARFYRWNRLAYTLLAAATFLLLVLYLGSLPDGPLYALGGAAYWGCRALQGAALLFLLRTPLRLSEFLGLRQAISRRPGPVPPSQPVLYTGKTYAVVRHPLYFGCSALLVFQPVQTRVSFVSTVMAVLYFWIGTYLEEARLVHTFGDAYREYRRSVPRFLPILFPRRPFRNVGPRK